MPLSFTNARNHLASAEAALDGWYARLTTTTGCYVADGHVVITSIDRLLRELHGIRGALIDEIRADEDERAVRVDRLLAESRTRRAAQDPARRVLDSAVGVCAERGGR
jgi:hypothetical protein